MRELIGRVAVVTHASAGIGLALARRAAREGMCVVLSDPSEAWLRTEVHRLRRNGAEVVGVRADLEQPLDATRLRQLSVEEFGGVHLLLNGGGPDPASLQNTLGAFVPLMLGQAEDTHIVNVVSHDCLGAVLLTESLDHQLRVDGSRLAVSVLCLPEGDPDGEAALVECTFVGVAHRQLHIRSHPQ